VLRRRATLNFQGSTLRFEVHDLITNSVDIYSAEMAGTPAVTR
jgi:hypothetical protein